jgi:hypothetical protein
MMHGVDEMNIGALKKSVWIMQRNKNDALSRYLTPTTSLFSNNIHAIIRSS